MSNLIFFPKRSELLSFSLFWLSHLGFFLSIVFFLSICASIFELDISSFGNYHDFAIFDQCKTSKNNYCNFPYTYTGGEKSELTGGQYNFLVSECEVYHIEFI